MLLVSLLLGSSNLPAELEGTWIGTFKNAKGEYMAHASGATQELVCNADGTCHVLTQNRRFLGSPQLDITRTGTYERSAEGVYRFKLQKDNQTVEVTGVMNKAGLVFSGDRAPFTFSKPTILRKLLPPQQQKPDGIYQLTIYVKETQTSATFPEIITIAGEQYWIANAKGEKIEEGKIALKPASSTDKTLRLNFASNTGKGRLHAKSWQDLYHGQIWSPVQGFSQAFPELHKSAGNFDTIYLEKLYKAE